LFGDLADRIGLLVLAALVVRPDRVDVPPCILRLDALLFLLERDLDEGFAFLPIALRVEARVLALDGQLGEERRVRRGALLALRARPGFRN